MYLNRFKRFCGFGPPFFFFFVTQPNSNPALILKMDWLHPVGRARLIYIVRRLGLLNPFLNGPDKNLNMLTESVLTRPDLTHFPSYYCSSPNYRTHIRTWIKTYMLKCLNNALIHLQYIRKYTIYGCGIGYPGPRLPMDQNWAWIFFQTQIQVKNF